jgi:hypothetical protein
MDTSRGFLLIALQARGQPPYFNKYLNRYGAAKSGLKPGASDCFHQGCHCPTTSFTKGSPHNHFLELHITPSPSSLYLAQRVKPEPAATRALSMRP